MTQAQVSKPPKAASGQRSDFVKLVRAAKGRNGATHAATEAGGLACGSKPHPDPTVLLRSSDTRTRANVPAWLPVSVTPAMFRPGEWFVSELSGSARELLDARPAIERLWGPMNWDYMGGRLREVMASNHAWPQGEI
jgi:hypothetical protein